MSVLQDQVSSAACRLPYMPATIPDAFCSHCLLKHSFILCIYDIRDVIVPIPCRGWLPALGGPWLIQLWHQRCHRGHLVLGLLIRITVCDHHVNIAYYFMNLLYPQCLSRLNLYILYNKKSQIFCGSCKNPLRPFDFKNCELTGVFGTWRTLIHSKRLCWYLAHVFMEL